MFKIAESTSYLWYSKHAEGSTQFYARIAQD